MFASKTMTDHLLRGAIGFGAVAAAIRIGATTEIILVIASLGLGAVALVALRGCPICWTTGLVEMIALKIRGTSETH